MKKLIALILLLLSIEAYACTCPMSTQDWWDDSDSVALVRVNAVGVAAQGFISGSNCVKGDRENPCVVRQVAYFSTIETYKGKIERAQLSSGYGGGDCGIPAVAGAYYVVFLRDKRDFHLSFCNAAGPYPPRYPYTRHNPKNLDKFLASLRAAAKDPNVKIEPRPRPMSYDIEGGL